MIAIADEMEVVSAGIGGVVLGGVVTFLFTVCVLYWCRARGAELARERERLEGLNGSGQQAAGSGQKLLARFVGPALRPDEEARAFDAGHHAARLSGAGARNPYGQALRAVTVLADAWEAGARVGLAERGAERRAL